MRGKIDFKRKNKNDRKNCKMKNKDGRQDCKEKNKSGKKDCKKISSKKRNGRKDYTRHSMMPSVESYMKS